MRLSNNITYADILAEEDSPVAAGNLAGLNVEFRDRGAGQTLLTISWAVSESEAVW